MFGKRENQELLNDAHDHLCSGADMQLGEQPVEMCVDGVPGGTEIAGHGVVLEVVENIPDDLKFPLGELQGAGNGRPRPISEQSGAKWGIVGYCSVNTRAFPGPGLGVPMQRFTDSSHSPRI